MKLFLRLFALLALLAAAPASGTVTSAQNTIVIAGNGSQTSFTFPFVGVSASDISIIFTSSTGVQTTLTQGPGSTQYQISLNAAAAGQLWGIGGTVTYDPGGTPIPNGSTLTIVRALPLTQTTTLQNQASFGQYAQSTEQAIDKLAMEIQQIGSANKRAITANIANSSPPAQLPPAAQAANQGLCFDGTGNNVVACSLAPSGTISSAMQPVVNAATLAAGRTAFGLGTMAQENINSGTCGGATIQDDGSGNARVVFGTAADGSNQTVTCAFHGSQRAATGALVYTLPQSSTLFNGFGFTVYALNNTVTFSPNGSDNFSGMSSGASLIIPAGTQAYLTTNASGTWYLNAQNWTGVNSPQNLSINCSVASNALTCSVVDRNGNNPSTASPVLVTFQYGTNNAQVAPLAITGALSITAPSGATLGTVNGQANRIWIGVFDNAGTPVLGFYNSLNGGSVLCWNETFATNGTAITSGSTSPQTWYTSGSVTGNAIRVLGYVESAQTTAGVWAASPSITRLLGPGVKKPGDIVQTAVSTISATPTTTSTTYAVLGSIAVAIAPRSAANLISVFSQGTGANATGSATNLTQLSRGAVNNTNMIGAVAGGFGFSGGASAGTFVNQAYDTPNTTGSVTYSLQGQTTGGTFDWNNPGGTSVISAMEIQI